LKMAAFSQSSTVWFTTGRPWQPPLLFTLRIESWGNKSFANQRTNLVSQDRQF
jgi:hypothetical protein